MADHSIYEKDHPARQATKFAICMGRVTSVDPASRLCSIKTFNGTHPSVEDRVIDKCQWLSMDANPAGDECTSIPRVNSIGMVLIIQGEAYIFGFIRGLNSQAQAITGDEVAQLTEGDKIFSTVGGNYFQISANGLLQLYSKATLYTLYIPNGKAGGTSLLADLCRNYQMDADGGHIDWKSDETDNTLFNATYRNNIAPIATLIEQNGAVDGGLTVIRRIAVAPGTGAFGNIFVYEQTVGVDGTVTTTVGPPGVAAYISTVKPDGSFSVNNGPGGSGGYSAAVDPTGALDLAFGPLVSVSVGIDGAIDVTTPGLSFSADATGNIDVTSAGKGSFTFADDVDMTIAGAVKIVSLGDVTLSAAGGIKLDGIGGEGAGAMFGVLTFPNVIDPLTGTPLGPGSTTVTASI
jgi:hypothetical protein